MNYLAHLYFAEPTPESLVGNLLPDFTKNIHTQNYSETILTGVSLHRFIDQYTDAHPIVQESKKRISSHRRRFSGILVDIFYDHFLAIHWQQYQSQTLLESTQFFYAQLSKVESELPPRLSEAIARMPEIDLLYNYRTLKGIEHAVDRVSQRIRFKNNLHGGIIELEENFDTLESDFHCFFSDLQKAVAIYKCPSSCSVSQSL